MTENTPQVAWEDPPTRNGNQIPIDPGADTVTVERVAPAEWPPQRGDLWRDRDCDLWFGYLVSHDGEDYVRLQCSAAGKEMAWLQELDEINRQHGPLTLVHRETAAGGEAK